MGPSEGYRTFLLRWDNSQLQDPTTIRNAFTQAFFSIGTGIGCILAYSAYLTGAPTCRGKPWRWWGWTPPWACWPAWSPSPW